MPSDREDSGRKVMIMKEGEIMYYNWNRMAMLSRVSKINELQQLEWEMRLAFSNSYANSNNESERKRIIESVHKTIDNQIIKSVDKFLK